MKKIDGIGKDLLRKMYCQMEEIRQFELKIGRSVSGRRASGFLTPMCWAGGCRGWCDFST